ncbi:hypothetical protein SJAV_21490 [Sulfurisphaera javensis]|uniref:Uncharacterized protein n=1 Tax=Sulfurisphaera javensis TaxID=2049879 RepID=A0AAT9GU27_9CREN
MEYCHDLLYSNIYELINHPECFISIDHYYRGRFALYQHNHKMVIKRPYVAIKVVTETRDSIIYIFGIDDSNKIFVMELLLTSYYIPSLRDLDIRSFLGFDYNWNEVTNIKEGTKIRIQGDLVLEVKTIFETWDEVLDHLADDFNPRDPNPLWEEFFRKYLGEKMRIAETLLPIYENYVRLYTIKSLKGKPSRETKKMKKDMNEIKSLIGRTYKTNFIDIDNIRRIVALRNREKFKDFLRNKVEKLKLRLGHYTAPHEVEVIGILTERGEAPTVALPPQKILLGTENMVRITLI